MAFVLFCLVAVSLTPLCRGAAVSSCPPEKPQAFCFASPCLNNKCGPGTTCVEDYCGGCFHTCEPVCPLIKCSQQCADGFKKDKNGCNTCECNTPICPLMACILIFCPNGYEEDENGCSTCQCKQPICPQVLCASQCTNGYQLDENGCKTCQCLPDKACEGVACQITEKCENGICISKGCLPGEPMAACAPPLPCATAKCAAGTVCVNNFCGGCSASCEAGCYYGSKMYAAGVSFPAGDGCNTCSCSGSNVLCTLQACPATKPGTCPKDPGVITTCDVRCSNDYECDGTEKCCSWGCSIMCIAPAPVCEYDGQTHTPGDSFPATDGCNTCTCFKDGSVGCTEIYCGCPLYKCKACSTGHVKDENGCDTCQCIDPKCEGVVCEKSGVCKNGICCPENKPYVACTINPCLRKRCGWWRSCRANYCGRCTGVCV